jgi:hypothetical protein
VSRLLAHGLQPNGQVTNAVDGMTATRSDCGVPMMLERLYGEATKRGWAAGEGSLREVQAEAISLGWTEVPTRRGGPAITKLRPTDTRDSPPNSLSAKYGKGAQPLHTDGAHLTEPPDVVVLACAKGSTTPTLLWSGKHQTIPAAPSSARHGVFLVNGGINSFFAVAYANGRYRYDPGCMTPCDARARECVSFFEEQMAMAVEHSWDAAGRVLAIDNRAALHARASAVDEPQREIERISFYIRRDEV